MATKKRNNLSLYELIKTAEREPKLSVRKLADLFQSGKTQISGISKNNEAVRQLYESNAKDDLRQARKTNQFSEYSDINDASYQWYQLCIKKNIHPDGCLLAEKAVVIAERIGHTDFKASNGWLHCWKVRNNIKQRKICGKSGALEVIRMSLGRKDCHSWLKVTRLRTFGTLMKWGFCRALTDKGLRQRRWSAKAARKANTG